MSFKKDFMWGAASAAYQVEGAYNEDGKGLNVWDVYSKLDGKIAHGENGNVACDHYHRYKEDIAMMKEIGIKYYRLSLSWTRIIPDGTGKINEAGIKFYSDLIDELLKNGIEPMVTLFHWDYPYALHCKGGWLNDESSNWFAEYAKVVAERFSDRVKYWMTINEPQMFIGFGYAMGNFAPFQTHTDDALIQMSKNVFLAHGKAVKVLRENCKLTPIIGFAPTGPVFTPASDSEKDIREAYEKSFDLDKKRYLLSNSWWGDPIALGTFPKRAYEIFGDYMNIFSEEDMKTIHQPLDFYGANVYQSEFVRNSSNFYGEDRYIGCPQNSMEWAITDDALYWSVKFLSKRYGLPILITENGMPCHDRVSLDGKVHDPNRQDFMQRYLRGLKKATDEGVDIIGYMYWSIMDNFEWTSGYDKRFGLIYVDYRTQQRTIKDSAYWYKTVIEANGENI